MPRFRYNAIAKDGENVRGELEAIDRLSALDQIAFRGLVPIDLSESSAHTGPWWEKEINLFGAAKVAPRHLVDFFAAFAILAEARVSLIDALRFSKKQISDKTLLRALTDIEQRIENGQPLVASMREHSDIFPDRVLTLIETGERSNTLDQAARRVADMLQSEAQMGGDLRAALIYPVILLVMAALVMGLVMFHLVPTLLPVFLSSGAEPPTSLRVLNTLRLFLTQNWVFVAIGLGALVFLPVLAQGAFTTLSNATFGRIPWVRSYRRERETLRFARVFGLMLESGATVPEALKATAGAMQSPDYRALLEDTLKKVEAGDSLSNSLSDTPLLHPIVHGLLQVGEQTDRLGPVLTTASQALEKSTQRRMKTMLSLITPILTLVIGLAVGAMVFTVISAILDLNDVAF